MDLKVAGVFWTFFYIAVLSSVLASRECRQCRPGLFASRQCTDTHDTVCSPCSKGTFTDTHNTYSECLPCSKCGEGEFVSQACSKHSDSICELCSSSSSEGSDNYLKQCFQNEGGSTVDEPRTIKIVENTEELEDGSTFPVHYNEGVYEGSGISVIDEVGVSKGDNETIEGSGEIPDISDEVTKAPVVILPDDGAGDELITNTTVIAVTETTPTGSPTPKVGDVSIDTGITLNNDSSPGYKSEVVVTTPLTESIHRTTAKRKTTPKTIVIDIDGGIVLATQKTTQPSIVLDDDEEDDVPTYDVVLPADDPHTGASRRQHSSEALSGVGVGVVVAVGLAAAFIFFVLGFLASRYWSRRRERSFNVLQAERRNGSTVTGGTIEYKDPENNISNKTGVYDEIPADKQNGTGIGADTKQYTPAAAENVYSQPVKRRPPKDTANDQNTDQTDTTGGREPEKPADPTSNHTGVQQELNERPPSNIQYIDETDSESETDKLLKPAPPNDNTNPTTETSPKTLADTSPKSLTNLQAEQGEDSNDVKADADEQTTESSPMLQKLGEQT